MDKSLLTVEVGGGGGGELRIDIPGNVWTDRNISWSEFNCSGWKLYRKLAAGVSGRSSCGNYNYFCPQNLWDKLDT